jgi:hypothetical protein
MAQTNSFTTPRGTRLPLLDLRGKDYLQVAHRLVWFREEHPTWSIETEPLAIQSDYAIFVARVKDENGRLISTGTKHETKHGFFDFIEKAETGAIGRALALCGYGTQFAPELDEEERIVDAPLQRPAGSSLGTPSPVRAAEPAARAGNGLADPDFRSYGPKATPRQVQYVNNLAVKKLGAHAGDNVDILTRLADKFGHDLRSMADLSKSRARMIIDTLQGMPDLPPGGLVEEEEPLLDFDESA